MADDKVVIGSNEGTPVKPGDLTKITSVINTDSAEDDSIATATIPRMKIKTGDNTDAQETSNINKGKIKAKLEEDKPKKKTTVKLKPVIVGETGEAAAAPVPPPAPAAALRIASVPAPAPVPAQATAVPRIASEDETVKIQKPRSVLASTAVPGVKQTIKLRPSSTTPAPISEAESKPGLTPPPQPPPAPVAPVAPTPALAGASEAKRTIRLVPKKSDATSGGEHSAIASKPSAPTIKLEEPPQTPQEPSRSASTIRLPSEAPSPEVASGTTPPQKRTLKLKSTRPPEATTVTPRPVPVSPFPSAQSPSPATPMPTPAPMPVPPPPPPPPPPVAGATDAEITTGEGESREIPPMPVSEEKVYKEETTPSVYDIQEPSIIFTIAACIAFFVMAYFAWMLVGQYCNNYLDKNITVPGLSGKVK